MYTFLKGVFTPGSVGFLAICLAAGLVLRAWPRRRRLSWVWLFSTAGIYGGLMLPVVANLIANRLPSLHQSPHAPEKLDTLFVLDGDNRRGRVRAALSAVHEGTRAIVWILGDHWITDELVAQGVPRSQLLEIHGTENTRGQIAKIKEYFAGGGANRTALIASRLQMPRVERLLESAGIDTALRSSPIDVEPPTIGAARFLPSYFALRVSRDAIYEHVALVYYRLRGWTK